MLTVWLDRPGEQTIVPTRPGREEGRESGVLCRDACACVFANALLCACIRNAHTALCHPYLHSKASLRTNYVIYHFISTNRVVTTGGLLEHICRHVCFPTADVLDTPNLGKGRTSVPAHASL